MTVLAGRRTCPGQHLASKSVFIAVVRLLWAFDISPPVDAAGNAILPDPNACRNGLTAYVVHASEAAALLNFT